MTKKEKFLLLVQIGLIIKDACHEIALLLGQKNGIVYVRARGTAALAAAFNIPEEIIPDDEHEMDTMAAEYISFQYGGTEEPPVWWKKLHPEQEEADETN